MRPIYFLLFLLLLPSLSVSAQRQNNIWYFGDRAGLDFNSGVPVTLSDGQTRTYEGTASIADRTTGQILFYTTGDSVWNREHRLMPNGTGLGGHWSSTQSALIVPDPGNSFRYYVFVTDAGPYIDQPNSGLHYAIVDMRSDQGRGDVVNRGPQLLAPCAEKLTAVPMCRGDGYWVLVHGLINNAFYAFALTKDGLSLMPVISHVGFTPPVSSGGIGYMKAAPSGKMLAVAYKEHDRVEVLEFDNGTGIVSRPIGFSFPEPYGLSFSPDNSKLYISRYKSLYLEQWEVDRYDPVFVGSSRMPLTPWSLVPAYALQLAPNGKIYLAIEGRQLGVIEQPDRKGSSCGFHQGGPMLGVGYCTLGLPNMIDAVPDLHEPVGVTGLHDTAVCSGESIVLRATGGVEYYWSADDGLLLSRSDTLGVTPLNTTTYYVEIITASGCNVHDSSTITVYPLPVVTAGPADSVICPGESLQLHASGAAQYRWQPAEGLSCVDCADPIAHPDRTTTYTVTGTNENGCSAIGEVTVTVLDTFKVDAGPDIALCRGDSAQLIASYGSAWHWSPATGLSCTDCQNPVASPTVTTLYSVVVENWAGCVGSDTVRVSILTPENVSAGPDATICSGDSVQLTATGDGRFLWTPGDGLSCTDCRSPMASPKQTTTYRLTVGSDDRCSITDSVTVTVQEVPTVEAGESQTTCRGGSVQLQASEGVMYQWSPTAGLSCTDCRNPVARPEETTMYRVRVTGANGCHGEDTVWVRVADEVMVDAGGGGVICQGESVQLSATGGGATYRWSPSAGLSCVDCSNPVASPVVSTLYSVVVTNRDGCIGSDTVRVEVRTASIDAGGGGVICVGDSMQLTATQGGAQDGTYRWSPSVGLSCDECSNPVASPTETTTYRVVGISRDGCIATDSVTIVVRQPDTIHVSIGGTMTAVPGGRFTVPLQILNPVAAPLTTMVFHISYNTRMLRFRDLRLDGSRQGRWYIDKYSDSAGEIFIQVVASSNADPLSSGELVWLDFDAFLGDIAQSYLRLNAIADAPCLHIESAESLVTLDSICGLSNRLMELSADKPALLQNDPNPFNPATRIRFSLPFDGIARLEVFSGTGELVGVLVNGYIGAGMHEAVWNADDQPSGLYYYRLTWGNLNVMRHMIVVK